MAITVTSNGGTSVSVTVPESSSLTITQVNKGDQGIQGIQGNQGVQGVQGPQGNTGATGADAPDSAIDSVVAGTGLTGGATSGDATLNVIGGTGITANANDIAITDGGIGTTQLANDSVTEDKLANTLLAEIDANTAKTTNATHSGDVTGSGALTIADDAVTYAKMQNLGTANRVLGATSTGAIGETQIVVAMMAANSVDSDQYVDGSIDHVHLALDIVDGDNIADNVIDSEHYVAASIDNEHLADNAVGTDEIADDAVTYAKVQNVSATNVVLGRDSSGAGVIEEISAGSLRTIINVEDGSTADQTKSDIDGLAITTVGTIDTGVWNGTVIANAYLDADTAHLTTAQTFTGVKTIGTNVKLQFRDSGSYINSSDANDLEIVGADITLDASNVIELEANTNVTGNLTVSGSVTHDYNTSTFESQLADDVGSGKIIKYSPGADDTLVGSQIYFLHTDGTWNSADADAIATGGTQMLGVGLQGSARTVGVFIEGFIRIASTEILNTPGSGAVDGLPLYVSTTAGHFDFTAPSGQGDFVRIVGYAIDDHSGSVLVNFSPSKDNIVLA